MSMGIASIMTLRLPALLGLILTVFAISAAASQVETKTVEVTGTGQTLKDAISDGLIEAIGQVAGRFIEAETSVKNLEVSATDGNDADYFSGQGFRKSVETATKGAITEYAILDQRQNQQGEHEVSMSVTCLRVVPSLSNRKRLLVTRFVAPNHIRSDLFNDALEAYIVQTRRFMLLDRENAVAVDSERKLMAGAAASIEDVMRAAAETVAELVLVGSIEGADYQVQKKTMRSGRTIEVGNGFMALNVRLIDTSTRQIKYANRVRYEFSEQELRELSPSFSINDAVNVMIDEGANRLGKQILETIYPLIIINVSGPSVTLNEGGRGVAAGQVYDVFALGDTQIDPYTKETLGRLETFVGKIRITSSTSKMANGEILGEAGGIAEGCVCRLGSSESASPEPETATTAPRPGKQINTDDLF